MALGAMQVNMSICSTTDAVPGAAERIIVELGRRRGKGEVSGIGISCDARHDNALA
jgi:hypothetical protein